MMMTEQQKAAVDKLSKLKVGALFMEMGTGKTLTALTMMAMKKDKVDMFLWICPCALKGEIESERQKWYPELQLIIVGCESIGSSSRIYLELLEKIAEKRVFIVVDESLKIKNRWANRTRRILKIGENAKYKLVLNGTPVSKNILDIWTQMEFLSPKILGMDFYEFKDTYCEYYTSGKLRGKVRRQVNIENLVSKIAPYIFECKLKIGTQRMHRSWFYKCDLNEYYAYKEQIFNKYYDAINDDLNFNAFTMKLQRWYVKNSSHAKRLQELIEYIDDKTIVFVKYLSSIPNCAKKITGEATQDERIDLINRMKNGEFDVLYITYGCGAYGLNLQFCENIIFSEQTWDYALQEQAEARIYRIGSHETVTYYTMFCDGIGLEDLMFECITKKARLLDTMRSEITRQGGIKKWVESI